MLKMASTGCFKRDKEDNIFSKRKLYTVRPRDTRPQAARTSTMHDFELGPKIFEMHVFGHFSFSCTILEDFSQFLHDFAQLLHDFAQF